MDGPDHARETHRYPQHRTRLQSCPDLDIENAARGDGPGVEDDGQQDARVGDDEDQTANGAGGGTEAFLQEFGDAGNAAP